MEYIEAAKLDPRLSQIALLRCLSILFQFTSPSADANAHEHFIFSQILCEPVFADFTKEVLPLVLSHVVTVPAPLWYRIVSHLTSRASHKYMGPTLIVPLLTWLFTWFPHHMNWHIQFLINSNRPSQPSVGKQIFLQVSGLYLYVRTNLDVRLKLCYTAAQGRERTTGRRNKVYLHQHCPEIRCQLK